MIGIPSQEGIQNPAYRSAFFFNINPVFYPRPENIEENFSLLSRLQVKETKHRVAILARFTKMFRRRQVHFFGMFYNKYPVFFQ